MNYYVRRHDGKLYGPYETRHEAVGRIVEFHDENTFTVEATRERDPDAIYL